MPVSVNLIELEITFKITCFNLVVSAQTIGISGQKSRLNFKCLRCSDAVCKLITSLIIWCKSTGSGLTESLPASILAILRISSIISKRCTAALSACCRYSFSSCSLLQNPSITQRIEPIIPLRGVRNSWEVFAKNWFFN